MCSLVDSIYLKPKKCTRWTLNTSMLNHQPIRPMCEMCNVLPARKNGRSTRGFQLWHKLCNTCAKHKYEPVTKNNQCSRCGFLAADGCQMCSVDSTTICQNCNALRLKELRYHSVLTVDATVDWANVRL